MNKIKNKEIINKTIKSFIEEKFDVTVEIYSQGSCSIGTNTKKSDVDQMFAVEFNTQKILPPHIIKKIFFETGAFLSKLASIKEIEQKNRCWNVVTENDDIDVVLGFRIKTMKPGEVCVYNSQHGHGGEQGELKLSNPLGYQNWFLNIADNPIIKKSNELRKLVISAKEHRDTMFRDKSTKKYKPIAIIITTLFAKYAAEYIKTPEIKEYVALSQYLIDRLNADYSKISHLFNPACKEEEYTDRWSCDDGSVRKESFMKWAEAYIKKNI